MSASITDTEEYRDFEARHNRHLNMLQDNVSHTLKYFLIYFFMTIG